MTPWRMLVAAAAVVVAAATTAAAQSVVVASDLSPLTFRGTYVLTKAGTSPTVAQARRCPVTVEVTETVTVANATSGGRPVVVITTDWFRVNGEASCVSPCTAEDVDDGFCAAGETNKTAQVLLFSSRDGFNATSPNNGSAEAANPLEVDLAAAGVPYYTGRTTGELRCGGGVTLVAGARSYWVYPAAAAVPLRATVLPSSTRSRVRSLVAGVRRVFFLLDDAFGGTWCGYAGASAVERDTSGELGLPAGVTPPAAATPPLPVVVLPPSPRAADGADGADGTTVSCRGQDGEDGADGAPGQNGGNGGKGGRGGRAGSCTITRSRR